MAASGNSNGRSPGVTHSSTTFLTDTVEPAVTTTSTVQEQPILQWFALDPLAETVEYIKHEVSRLPKPDTANDLFDYCYEVQWILRSHPDTEYLLNPLPSDTPLLARRLSRLCQSILQQHLGDPIIPMIYRLHRETYEFLQYLQDLIPHVIEEPSLTMNWPERRKTETFYGYLSRFELWQARFLPDQTPGILRFCAAAIWKANEKYCTSALPLAEILADEQGFTSIDDVFDWFKKQRTFTASSAQSPSYNQGRRHAQPPKGKPKNQGSSQNQGSTPRPLAADKDSRSQKPHYGKVSKQYNARK